MDMKIFDRLLLILVAVAVVGLVIFAYNQSIPPDEPIARSYNTTVYTEQGGGKLVVASSGEIEMASGSTLDIQAGATAVIASALSLTGEQTSSGGLTNNNWVKLAAPTAIATATPAVVIDSLGVSKILDVRDAATPVFSILNGGAWTSTGAGTHSSGQTVNNWVIASAPTAIATATPAMVVDSLGLSNIFEVRDAATPVFAVNNGGAVVGLVLKYGSSGEQLVVGTDQITTTATAAHGLTTVTFALCTLGEDPTSGANEAAMCTVVVSGNTVTLKIWQDDFVSAATETDVDIHWLVVGTP